MIFPIQTEERVEKLTVMTMIALTCRGIVKDVMLRHFVNLAKVVIIFATLIYNNILILWIKNVV